MHAHSYVNHPQQKLSSRWFEMIDPDTLLTRQQVAARLNERGFPIKPTFSTPWRREGEVRLFGNSVASRCIAGVTHSNGQIVALGR